MDRLLRLAALLLTLIVATAGTTSTSASGSNKTAAIHWADPATLRSAVAMSASRGGSTRAEVSVGPGAVGGDASNTVTLEIVMPDDAPRPGDAGCDPSYPQLCVAVGAADLDCEGMGVAGFIVLAPDVHRLDDDGDGLGCED